MGTLLGCGICSVPWSGWLRIFFYSMVLWYTTVCSRLNLRCTALKTSSPDQYLGRLINTLWLLVWFLTCWKPFSEYESSYIRPWRSLWRFLVLVSACIMCAIPAHYCRIDISYSLNNAPAFLSFSTCKLKDAESTSFCIGVEDSIAWLLLVVEDFFNAVSNFSIPFFEALSSLRWFLKILDVSI